MFLRMTLTLKSCFVTLAILFIWQVEEGAEACTCMQSDPQQAICSSDVVIRANIIGREEVVNGTMKSVKYVIYVIEMFKGPWGIRYVYTSGPCRAYLDNDIGTDYLLTGRQDADGTVHISMCNFLKPLHDLSATELSLIQNLGGNCG
ncbi:metalloproteinase inhibitor 2 [Austrofundulus limnaeus]|uniref:Metalloproteinase inhibitor 2 n=1 Tax=Austrofundulus limnaeus TaxID=52670 RepID=A0A2I4BCM0_AUSLI|nr:PREDICTED: metalloproteinase inhibitor 2-like [Austrofundulus limnaeus]